MKLEQPGHLELGGHGSEAAFAAAEELAALGAWGWHGGRDVALSAGLASVLGFAPSAAIQPSRALFRRIEPDHRPRLLQLLRAARAGEAPGPVDLCVTHPDGPRILAVTARPAAQRSGLWGLCRDVTEKRELADALDRSESRWEMALESAGQGVWDTDVATGEVYHSRTWRRMRGLDADGDPRATHAHWLERLHPDDRHMLDEQNALQQVGKLDRVAWEYRERHIDGHYMWIASLGRPVEWFPDGRPSRIIGTDTDITARKLAEEEMARLSRRLELALGVSQIGVFEANLEDGSVYWDSRVREIYGKAPGEPIGRADWEGFLHPEDRERATAAVGGAVEAKGSYESEFRIIRGDGAVRTVRTRGLYYRGGDGVPRMLGANWDVTDEVAAQEELHRTLSLLEARNVELEATKARIEHNALHDSLTGLPNRRFLDSHLARCAAWCAETGGRLALLHVDLDRFKQINDTLGHVAGDAMLVHAAGLLRSALSPGEFVARVGGDEFILVCPFSGSTDHISALAETLLDQMRRPVPYEGHFCRFGASIGIAIQSGASVDPRRMLIDADIALYRAKGAGKNRHEFFSEALQAETVKAKRLADDILRAIEQDEFLPWFQPLFDARSLALVGVEALARWRHPTEGVLGPAVFLKVAEDLNVVTAIDRVILEKGLLAFEQWRSVGLDVPSISVNVSFRRLHDPQLGASLRELPIRPGTLSFELLESIFLDEPDEIVAWNLDQIRDMGIDINVDDFGTGHASIISLLKLRPRRFKLDRQFLADLTTSAAQRRLVRSLIDIGRSLSIKVVAEGVETHEQARILRDLGCDALQGFAFARPMPGPDLEEFLRTEGWRKAS